MANSKLSPEIWSRKITGILDREVLSGAQMDMFKGEKGSDPLSKAIILDAIVEFQELDPDFTFSDIFNGVDALSWSSDAALAEWLTKRLEGFRESLSEEAMKEDDCSDPFYTIG